MAIVNNIGKVVEAKTYTQSTQERSQDNKTAEISIHIQAAQAAKAAAGSTGGTTAPGPTPTPTPNILPEGGLIPTGTPAGHVYGEPDDGGMKPTVKTDDNSNPASAPALEPGAKEKILPGFKAEG